MKMYFSSYFSRWKNSVFWLPNLFTAFSLENKISIIRLFKGSRTFQRWPIKAENVSQLYYIPDWHMQSCWIFLKIIWWEGVWFFQKHAELWMDISGFESQLSLSTFWFWWSFPLGWIALCLTHCWHFSIYSGCSI